MGLFDKLFSKKQDETPAVAPKKTKRAKKEKAPEPVLTEKGRATAAGEPYIAITKVELDPNNINAGAFEMDWNSIFITQLVKAGYMKKKEDTDSDIADRWFQDVCRNVALELYEQVQADPANRDVRPIQSRDIGNGRTEVS